MKTLFLVSAVLLLLVPGKTFAGLGQRESSVENDVKSFSSSRHTMVEKTNFTVHEIASGTITIREYVSSSGTVFGIAWAGDRHPDLSALLGEYFPDFAETSKKAPAVRGRRPFSVVTGDKVVVEKSGHMRAVQGKAYAPELLPPGVTASDIL